MNCSDEPGWLALSIPAKLLSDVGRHNGPGNSDSR
jgi:hypothetical protein